MSDDHKDAEAQKLLARLDKNGDGSIDAYELQELMTMVMGRAPSQEHVVSLGNMCDENGNGSIEEEELVNVLTKWWVDVTRARSFRVLRGLRVSLPSGDYGKDYVTVDSAGQYGKLAVADEIYVAGEYFAVRKVQDGGATIRLGQPGDHTKLANVTGPYVSNARVSTWAFGYEWTVTLHAVTTASVEMLSSPAHSLAPVDTAVSISSPASSVRSSSPSPELICCHSSSSGNIARSGGLPDFD